MESHEVLAVAPGGSLKSVQATNCRASHQDSGGGDITSTRLMVGHTTLGPRLDGTLCRGHGGIRTRRMIYVRDKYDLCCYHRR